jgi:hypothetical protein
MRVLHAALLLLATASQAPAQVVHEMTPELIRQAIAEGARTKNIEPYKVKKLMGTWATYTTPYRRVMLAAQDAKKKYKTFTEADVTPEMVAPELHVYAPAWAHEKDVYSVAAIVITKKGSKEAIQPTKSEPTEEEFSNTFGKEVKARGMRASFPLSVVNASNEIRIVFDGIPEKNDGFDIAKMQ